jgi:hypothetical protein
MKHLYPGIRGVVVGIEALNGNMNIRSSILADAMSRQDTKVINSKNIQ